MAPRALRQSRSNDEFIQLAIRLVLLAFLLYWSFVLVRPFIPILAWSMVLTVAFYPAYNWLSIRLGNRPKVAALIITMINLAIIIGPVTWLGFGLIDGLQGFAAQLGEGSFAVPSAPEGIKDWPIVGARIYGLWDQASTNLRAALRELAPHLKPLAGPVLAFAGSAGVGTFKFILSVVLAGFLFFYGPDLVAATRRIQARLIAQRSEDFVGLAGLTIRTVSQGVIGVAVLQSLLAGIGLKLAGVPHAGVLAFVVLILAILQIGSVIVILPVIVWIWATKEFTAALLLTVYLLIVSLADNVLKPMLMGRGLSTPMFVIFVGVMGGMLAHGIVGLFVGPIILAVAWELMVAWIGEDQAGAVSYDAEHSKEKVAPEIKSQLHRG
ncbi:MAG: AI-2E family transporter [Alphaproteobacteria bacterium]|nr:MAG: AI-2E family transporter [Alphaproteobacteria bacterium]